MYTFVDAYETIFCEKHEMGTCVYKSIKIGPFPGSVCASYFEPILVEALLNPSAMSLLL